MPTTQHKSKPTTNHVSSTEVGKSRWTAKANLTKHRVSFLTAAQVFANEIVERIDDREDYGELRFIALGRVDTEVYRVVFTWRGENLIRIISAQKASRDEREIYYRAIHP